MKMVMEESKGDITSESEEMDNGIDSMEIARGFAFSALPLTNPIFMRDFKREQNTQTYIKVYHHTFGCDPTNNKVLRWFKY